jgi:ubiquinone/menaquinone biosynthesis C-methylase UbiE
MVSEDIPKQSSPKTFDPAAYKATTREQWQQAAAAWHRWGPTLAAWLGPATDRLLDMAGIERGQRVLDVAAGAGEQTLAIAARVGTEGHVLATDIAPAILEYAAAEAARAGLTQVATRAMDGENLEVPEGSFDAVVSRAGLIYFPDQQAALRGMRRALRPGGRFAAIVYSTPEQNGFFSTPVSIIRRRAKLGPPLPGQPGPFSLGSHGVLEKALQTAGFRDIRIETREAPLRLSNAAECVRFEKESFGALHQMLASLGEADQRAAWDEILEALGKYEGPEGFVGPCELVLAVGTR